MRISIITIFPEMFDSYFANSIIKRAKEKEKVTIDFVDPREFADNPRQVDDYLFGGSPGMLLKIEPIVRALESIKTADSYVVLTSANGHPFKQEKAIDLSTKKHLIIICGRYEGVDGRIVNFLDEEISIGDYVLTGGELAAMIISDSIIRLLDNVINHKSLNSESYNNNLLEGYHYTRPVEFLGYEVPEVLLSGHHKNIEKYRLSESEKITQARRPDLYKKYLNEKE
ncbi:MAG: tRNA (guanosine(37)-N1)-methyltransferase TrmD [Erysipelotrichaceae bacterium]